MTDAQLGKRIKAQWRVQDLNDRTLESMMEYGGSIHLKQAAARVLARRAEERRRSSDSSNE